MSTKKSQTGVTLLEVMLVMAIAASLLIMGISQYKVYYRDSQIQQMKLNVNWLFQGLKGYFQATCSWGKGGAFDPSLATPVNPYLITNIRTTLFKPGYLDRWPPPANPLVDDTGAPNRGYIVQFNLVAPTASYPLTRYTYACPDPNNPQTCTTPQPIAKKGSVIVWQAQVAVQMADPTMTDTYFAMSGADCESNMSGTVVTPCSQNPVAPYTYLVWERLPNYSAEDVRSASPLWPSMLMVKQFNQQYTNDAFYALGVDDPTYNTATGYEIYGCGG